TPAALNTQNLAPHSPSAHKRRRKRRRYARVLEPHAEIRQAVPTGRLRAVVRIAAFDDVPEHDFEVETVEDDHVTGTALTGPLAGQYGEPEFDLIVALRS
ncbi:hypothetical protein P6F28_00160, partial [Roseicyclus marinus]